MLFLGVDGGGTKTLAVLVDEEGKLICKGAGGSSNIAESPKDVVKESFRSALRNMKEHLKDEKVISVFGLTSVGELRGVEEEYARIVEEVAGFRPDLIVEDVVIAWAAGTLGRGGVHVVAGTGSIAYGRAGGKETRVGGWGSYIGDEGSAYEIGLKGLREIARQLDGRSEESVLKFLVFSSLGLKDRYDFLEWVYDETYDRRRKIASIAMYVYRAAKMGDGKAMEILEEAGRKLADLAVTAAKKIGISMPLVSYSGSVLEKNEFVREEFIRSIKEELGGVEVRRIRVKPVYGAVLLAADLAGIDMEDMYERMSERSAVR